MNRVPVNFEMTILTQVTEIETQFAKVQTQLDEEEKKIDFLAKYPINTLTELFAGGKVPSMKDRKIIKQYFKNYRITFHPNPNLFIAETTFINSMPINLTYEQQIQYLKIGFNELVLRSDESSKKKYCDIFRTILTGISSLVWCESCFLESLLLDILLKYQSYQKSVKKIVALFSSCIQKRILLGETLEFEEIKFKVEFHVPSNHKTFLPLELYKAMPNRSDAAAYTNKILSKTPGIWVKPVLGESPDDFKNKDFLAACHIVENFKPNRLKDQFLKELDSGIFNFDLACVIVYEYEYDNRIREQILRLLTRYFLYCLLQKKGDMKNFHIFYKSVISYQQQCSKISTFFNSISIEEIIYEVTVRVIHGNSDLLDVLRHLSLEYVASFSLALTKITHKDKPKILDAVRLAWMIPGAKKEEQLVAMKKIGMVWASLQ